MPDLAMLLPARRPEFVVRPLGYRGPYLLKDPGTGTCYHLGEEEHSLPTRLDLASHTAAMRAPFAGRSGRPLFSCRNLLSRRYRNYYQFARPLSAAVPSRNLGEYQPRVGTHHSAPALCPGSPGALPYGGPARTSTFERFHVGAWRVLRRFGHDPNRGSVRRPAGAPPAQPRPGARSARRGRRRGAGRCRPPSPAGWGSTPPTCGRG